MDQEFSDIAFAKFLQTVPELESFVLTFQDMTDELPEDSGIRAGVFVLRIGAELFFVPVIDRGGSPYTIDTIFSEAESRFMPLSTKTLPGLLAKAQVGIGRSTKIPDTVTRNPSVYHLINPPRTGKHVYASASRLTEFFATLPGFTKQAVLEAVRSEKSLYDKLDSYFGLKTIFEVLSQAAPNPADTPGEAPLKVVTAPELDSTDEERKQLISAGYYLKGHRTDHRIAVLKQDFNKQGTFREISALDGDRDFSVVLKNGEVRQAYLAQIEGDVFSGRSVAIFTDGSYAIGSKFVSAGEPLARREVLQTLFNYAPPTTAGHLYRDDTFVILLNSGKVAGPFHATSVVTSTYETVVKVSGSNVCEVHFSKTFGKSYEFANNELYVPHGAALIKLNEDRTCDLEQSTVRAMNRTEVNDLRFLGDTLDLRFDGIEYSINGQPVGDVPKAVEVLIVREGIAPEKAEQFIKQAQVTKLAKIYLTKKAYSTDFQPQETPEYGMKAPRDPEIGLNGSFIRSAQEVSPLNDPQVLEATIISELLQTPDMFETIEEYIPEIEEAVDRLGRTLFLMRINATRLSQAHDADGINSFMASTKNAYKLLGENLSKLREIIQNTKMDG